MEFIKLNIMLSPYQWSGFHMHCTCHLKQLSQPLILFTLEHSLPPNPWYTSLNGRSKDNHSTHSQRLSTRECQTYQVHMHKQEWWQGRHDTPTYVSAILQKNSPPQAHMGIFACWGAFDDTLDVDAEAIWGRTGGENFSFRDQRLERECCLSWLQKNLMAGCHWFAVPSLRLRSRLKNIWKVRWNIFQCMVLYFLLLHTNILTSFYVILW